MGIALRYEWNIPITDARSILPLRFTDGRAHGMNDFTRPALVPHARYRWDKIREQHQIVYPEGVLVLNETGAAIVRLCDGRTTAQLLAALGAEFPDAQIEADVEAFLARIDKKGLLRDAPAS